MKKDGFFKSGFITDGMDLSTSDSSILLENRKFSSQYAELMRQEENQLDARNQYKRTIMQTVNIGIATCILFGLILYNQT
jgi:hypothetical protein